MKLTLNIFLSEKKYHHWLPVGDRSQSDHISDGCLLHSIIFTPNVFYTAYPIRTSYLFQVLDTKELDFSQATVSIKKI